MNIIQALNQTLHQEFARNNKIVHFGEDAGAFGGVFRVTSGLQEAFGEGRVFDTHSPSRGSSGMASVWHKKGSNLSVRSNLPTTSSQPMIRLLTNLRRCANAREISIQRLW